MKVHNYKRFLIPIITLSLTLSLCACNKKKQEKVEANPYCVFVCSGRNAKRYHSVSDCKGLSKCGGYVREMSINEAEHYGKTPCRMCVKRHR